MQLDFSKLMKLAYPGEPSIFTESQLKKINEIIKYHDYYEGNNFKYIEQVNPEYKRHMRGIRSYTPTQISINYIRKIIDKLTSFQFEKSVDISAEDGSENGKAEDVETYLYQWHKENKLDLKHLQAAKEHNITGGVAYKLLPDENRKEARAYIRERIECFPVTEFDDYEKINKVHFIAFVDEETIWKQSFEMVGERCFIEEATYAADNLMVKEQILDYQPLTANGVELDFMPVYIIPNLPMLGEVWGLSEVKDLISLADEINRKYSDLADSLRFEMFAITILLNITELGDNESFQTKPGAVWNLIGGGDNKPPKIEKLESRFQYIESLRYHLESMKSLMFELSDCIQLEGKQIESVGNMSGVALRMLFANMISKINQKNTIWMPILSQMYTDAAKIKSYYDSSFKLPEDLTVSLIPHVPVPLNEKEQVEIITQKLAFDLISISAAMDELGVENPELMVQEILNDKKTFEEALSAYSGAEETQTDE